MKIRRALLTFLLAGSSVGFACGGTSENAAPAPSPSDAGAPSDAAAVTPAAALAQGLKFLTSNQLADGSFQSTWAWNMALKNAQQDPSPFNTAHILYSLSFADPASTAAMRKLAVAYLSALEKPGGIWHFWTTYPADLDDTAIISTALAKNGIKTENSDVFLNNRDAAGLYYTWLGLQPNDYRQTLGDCVVGANILIYTGNRPENAPTCARVNKALVDKTEATCDRWYHAMPLYYAMSAASFNGITCVAESNATVLSRVLALQAPDGSYDTPIDTALAANTMLNLHHKGPELDRAMKSLIASQSADGSWPEGMYFLGGWFQSDEAGVAIMKGPIAYYGSRALSTGFALEAVARYAKQ